MFTRIHHPLLKKSAAPPTTAELVNLLQRAADSLQSYCADSMGDMNDSLAMEIYSVLERIPKTAGSKKGYGYDTSGAIQEQSGSAANQKNIEESNGSQPQDGHSSNPVNGPNSMSDSATEEFPELNRPSKIRFLPPRGLR
jgi:DNA repair ATPase RecN